MLVPGGRDEHQPKSSMNVDCRQCYLAGEKKGGRYVLAVPRDTGSAGAGSRIGSQAGRSIDFRDYRDYQPGDDLRWIDWNVYGRTDHLTIRLHHEEVSPHLDLLIDTSRSMDLGQTAKAEALLQTAALLAVAARHGGCSCACWLIGDRVRRLAGDQDFPRAWESISFTATAEFAGVLAGSLPPLRRNGIRILLSDLMWEADPLPLVRQLGHQASALSIIQILAHEELDPPGHGNTRLMDAETGALLELFVDETVRDRYLRVFNQHRDNWAQACRSVGSRFLWLDAERETGASDAVELRRSGVLEDAR